MRSTQQSRCSAQVCNSGCKKLGANIAHRYAIQGARSWEGVLFCIAAEPTLVGPLLSGALHGTGRAMLAQRWLHSGLDRLPCLCSVRPLWRCLRSSEWSMSHCG